MREQQTLGRRIQEARKAAGLSQEILLLAVKISSSGLFRTPEPH